MSLTVTGGMAPATSSLLARRTAASFCEEASAKPPPDEALWTEPSVRATNRATPEVFVGGTGWAQGVPALPHLIGDTAVGAGMRTVACRSLQPCRGLSGRATDLRHGVDFHQALADRAAMTEIRRPPSCRPVALQTARRLSARHRILVHDGCPREPQQSGGRRRRKGSCRGRTVLSGTAGSAWWLNWASRPGDSNQALLMTSRPHRYGIIRRHAILD